MRVKMNTICADVVIICVCMWEKMTRKLSVCDNSHSETGKLWFTNQTELWKVLSNLWSRNKGLFWDFKNDQNASSISVSHT